MSTLLVIYLIIAVSMVALYRRYDLIGKGAWNFTSNVLLFPLTMHIFYGHILVQMHLRNCTKCMNGGFPCHLLRSHTR